MIYLRAADRFDARALAELRAASLVELELLPVGERATFAARAAVALDAMFADELLIAWVVCDGETVVGSCCAVFFERLPYPDGSRHAELCGVYVVPAYRNRGFATELVGEVVAAAGACGARKTFLRPSRASHALYARLGFVDSTVMTFAPRWAAASGTESVLAASPRG